MGSAHLREGAAALAGVVSLALLAAGSTAAPNGSEPAAMLGIASRVGEFGVAAVPGSAAARKEVAKVEWTGALAGRPTAALPGWVPGGHVSDEQAAAFQAELLERAAAPEGSEVTFDPDLTFSGYTVAELEDVVFLANDQGVTVEESLARGVHASDISALAYEWESRDGYAGWGLDGNDPYVIWKGELPQDVASDLRTARFGSVDVFESTVDFGELQAASERLLDQLSTGPARGVVTFVDVDPLAPRLEVTTNRALENGITPLESVTGGVAVSVTYTVDPSIEFEPEPDNDAAPSVSDSESETPAPSSDVTLRGGSDFDTCTSGFTVASTATGLRRLATAGHCATHGRDRVYRNHPVDGTSAATLRSPTTYWWDGLDLGHFATGGRTALATYYYDFNAKRYVERRGSPSDGQLLSVFGWATGERKSAIVSVVSRSCSGGEASGKILSLTVMDRSKTKGGDSGGPWFTTTDAVGIHSGHCQETGTNSFSRVSLLNSRGWQVSTR